MEMGIGFFVGLLSGAVVSIIVASIVIVSRKATKGRRATEVKTAVAPPQAKAANGETASLEERRKATRTIDEDPKQRRTGHTLVVGTVDSQQIQLDKHIQETRTLLMQLAEIVCSTGTASGNAAKAFDTARGTIDEVDTESKGDLTKIQSILLREIDRVIRSNATLTQELDRANHGIAEQRRQIEELRVAARIDGLTQIPNRAAFNERLEEYINLMKDANSMFSLLLLDIDHFKKINDQYGHVNGDRILRGVASKIIGSIRANDFAARYGGEEFAVLFPFTKMDEALQVSERIRQDLAKTNFRLDNQVIKMTISGGIAECSGPTCGEDVIGSADKALYDAKEGGRNRIITAAGGEEG